MYWFPFLSITSDDVRNAAIADIFEDELSESQRLKNEFYSSLHESGVPQHKALFDLLELERLNSTTMLDIFRTNFTVLEAQLPDIDVWRIREKTKRLLTFLRLKGKEIIHPFDDFSFSDKLRKPDLWEDNTIFRDAPPQQWNTIILNRISDIHHHLSKLVEHLEKRILTGIDLETTTNTGAYLESTRSITREIKDYTRLINSL